MSEIKLNPHHKVRTRSKDGSIHVTDEFYNGLISGLGALLSAVGVFFLINKSLQMGSARHVVSFSIYGTFLIVLLLASCLHHWIDGSERVDLILKQIDYCAIFTMIAGSFTPYCLILLNNNLGNTLLWFIWGLAIAGIILHMLVPTLPKWFSTLLYVGMGLVGLFIVPPLYLYSVKAIGLLIGGGLFFLVGAVIYYFEGPNPAPGRFGFHEIWHCFVVAGATCHFLTMYLYILPIQ